MRTVALLVLFATFGATSVVLSRPTDRDVMLGQANVLHIHPIAFSSEDWNDVEQVLRQEVSEEAIFQKFDRSNSAYIYSAAELKEQADAARHTISPTVISPSVPQTTSSQLNSINNAEQEAGSPVVDQGVEQSEETDLIELPESPVLPEASSEPESTTEPSSDDTSALETSAQRLVSDAWFAVLQRATELFPLTSTTTEIDVDQVETMVSDPIEESVETVVDTTPGDASVDSSIEADTVFDNQFEATQAVEFTEPQVPADSTTSTLPAGSDFADELPVADEQLDDTLASTTASSTDAGGDTALSESVTVLQTDSAVERLSLSLSNFSIPKLDPGEFITAVQLRASLAAQYDLQASSTLPYFDFVLQTPSSTQSLGSVVFEDETSNALNGGYFLFALPAFQSEADFDDISIEVAFVGDRKHIRDVLLDSVWLEVHTEKITRADLYKRAETDLLRLVRGPQTNEFVSSQVDFTRREAPVFNLRYISQRSKMVQSIRTLFGYDKVRISKVDVLHAGVQPLGIKPDMNVTSDGLISFTFPEEELKKLRPGKYTVTFEVDEGGYTFSDSFEFQWGLLAINPDQTEYVAGDTATISMGALTPSGNTLCEADLRLYIIDPNEFIHKVPVAQSGLCDGNNVIDVPDYTATYETTVAGSYEMYLERLNEAGEVLSHTSDTFEVVAGSPISLSRTGPTRIYPVAPYRMELTLETEADFTGAVIERVPASFEILNTNAAVERVGDVYELRWEVDVTGFSTQSFIYEFDAPDLSPFLYELGPATVLGAATGVMASEAASEEIGTSTVEVASETGRASISFEEHRQWQIASDAVGNMILFFDGPSIPSGWTCLSCGSGTFYQRFVMGSSTYNTTGGAATHTHTADGSVLASNETDTNETGGSGNSETSHTHSYTPVIGTASNLPEYRQLQVIQYTAAAGEPALIPAGAIGIFDVASSSLPANWNRYAAQDGRYIYGENTIGTTGGSNTHTHSISGTTGTDGGSGLRARGNNGNAAPTTHTHTVSATTGSVNNEPPYIEVVLAQAAVDVAPGNGLIAMWTDEVAGGWIDVSSNPGDPFSGRFIKPATTYGATGGSISHSHADVTGITSSGPSAISSGGGGNAPISSDTHTHQVSVTNFSTDNHLPPYITAVFGKRQGTNPVFDQLSYQWYVNQNQQTPSDPWPPTGSDLLEGEPITENTVTVKDNDRLRLRINALVTNATSTASTSVKLQYAAAPVCGSASEWFDVGDSSSSTALWRGYVNGAVADGSVLASTTLASTTVAQTYEDNGAATSTPNQIGIDGVGEWDFVLEHNGAAASTNYCFRLVETDDTPFGSYTTYPQLLTNRAPNAPTLNRPFDNEKKASTTLSFRFVTTDPEGEALNYQIQIDNDYDFSSTVEDRNTISNSAQFENQVDIADKAPFTSGQLIEFDAASTFTNGTTYYWRVRAADPSGSTEWGEWSTIYSFTIDTGLTASAWFQTTDEQFDTNTLAGVESTGSDAVDLITGSTTGTMISDDIVFAEGELGTAWDSFTFNDIETSGDIKYTIQYLTDAATWVDIPDGDLPGNSAGFDTSPINLLNLEVETYDTLRIAATFTNSGGSPSLQDWTINWGYRVDTPTIAKLFPNEKVGTTTPVFEFTTTDPQNDGLTYQISWSTDNTFTTSTTTRTSDTHTGFENIDNGAQISPLASFTSGNDIQFTVQSGDALTNGTTYWWRVRAKDPAGDDAWSFWTEPRSFTVDTTVVTSTWFQTTQEQFDTDVLSGTIALTNDTVSVASTAVEAMVVYGEGIETEPRYRIWNGTTWGAEDTLQDIAAPVQWARVEENPVREEYVAVTIGTDADVNAQVYSLGEWGNLQEMTSNLGNVSARGMDVAYETLSGDALVVYCNNAASPSYRVWNGSTWSAETLITVSETTNCEWIKLAADPTSDEIVMVMRGTDGTPYEAQVWSGSGWGNSTTLGSITDTAHEGMSVMYEESGDQAIVVTSLGNQFRFTWTGWNGTTWSAPATVNLGDDFEWGTLVRDVGSDEIALCYQDEDTNIGYIRWTGAAWTGQGELLTTTGKAKTDPGFSCVFEAGGARDNYIMVAYTDTTQMNYSFWNNTAWSTPAQLDGMGDTITSELTRTDSGDILGIFFDETNDDLLFSEWNGTLWSTSTAIENDASIDATPYGRPYSITPRGSGSEGTVIVSPGIDFTDGLGPYWQEFSWNDTTPGTSDILYSMQYWDGDSWEFVPNSLIPNNDVGTSTGPIDLTSLNKNTYGLIRPYAALTCDGSGNCPQLQDWTVTWAEGITVSGTLQEYDQATNVNSGTVAVAVNGVLQNGKTGTVASGLWSIPNVTVFEGDVVTVFVSDTADSTEAVGVTRYDGLGDITGMTLFERHVSLGSNDATTTPLTNADVFSYNATNDEDVFLDASGTSTLNLCADVGCSDVRLFIASSTVFAPGGDVLTHDIEINGTLTATSTLHITGSWDNNGTTTLTNSTVIMSATSTTESIDTTAAAVSAFNNLTFGTTTGAATWNLLSALDVNGNLTVARGTLDRASTLITIAGDLLTQANGFWTGVGTTTFDGATPETWTDQNAVAQNVGHVLIDGANKAISLGSDVLAQSLTIGANDSLDVTVGNYTITVYERWLNNNTFIARAGEVVFAATSTTYFIDDGGSSFYDLSFNGVGGAWAFDNATLSVTNDLTIATGTVTLPTGTTTIAGSFNNSGGQFAHSNATVVFSGAGAETITTNGDAFNNSFYDLTFSGGGSWTFTEAFATSSNDVRLLAGTVVLPSDTFSIGGSLLGTAGLLTAGTGTVRMVSNLAEDITLVNAQLHSLFIEGSGAFTMTDTDAVMTGDLTIAAGSLSLPSGTLSLGGSFSNNATFNANAGEIQFTSTDTGETIDFGASSAYDLTFSGIGGGWTIIAPATSTNAVVLTEGNDFTLASGQTLAIGNSFTNSLENASTTWTGSTLSLYGGTYTINTKTNDGDTYGTLLVTNGTGVSMWNSDAAAYTVASGSYLYSMDHADTPGELNIWGDYTRTSGAEYWSYATDFDGALLDATTSRQVNVNFAAGATAALTDSTLEIVGDATSSTTISNQGAGTYTVTLTDATTTAQYFDFTDLGGTGVSLLGTTTVTTFTNGYFTVAGAGGSALTIASSTIDADPGRQLFNIGFATTSAISAFNVTAPAASSYWWFRDSYGNLDGEVYDNDDGNPGSVRWDDSALVLTISGNIYADDGTTLLGGTTCDGDVSEPVTVVVTGGATYTGSCTSTSSYSVNGVTVVGDPTITIYLNGADGGEQAVVVTKTATADITDLDLYVNRVIVRHEDVTPLSIADMAWFDDSNDPDDITFTAATGTTDSLVVEAGNELYVWNNKTFTPDGVITLSANATANDYDGTLHLGPNATFTGAGTTTYTIGGSIELENGATFIPASTTILMTATTSGKTIDTVATSSLAVYELRFVGVNGGWNINGNVIASADIEVAAGTVTGTGDITLTTGSFSGSGLVSLGGGTATIESTNTLGGTQAWTFNDLVLGDGINLGTTTPAGTATTTVLGTLTIASAHFLDAGSSYWDLAGSGAVFVETGNLLEDTSTFTYSGTSSTDIISTDYYNLTVNSIGGSPTFTATGIGIQVFGDMQVGGASTTIVNFDTNDTALNIDGNLTIAADGTFIASASGTFTLAGSYNNDGVFTASGGTLLFDGAGAQTIAAGNSSFASVDLAGTGSVTVLEHATATAGFTIGTALTDFTLTSGQTLAVGGTFTNDLGGLATEWSGSQLYLFGGNNYEINAKSISDSYATLTIANDTQIRMWNSEAGTVNVSGGSLYSMDHANNPGELYIFGTYLNTVGTDHWSYETDFDGSDLGVSDRPVAVYVTSGGTVQYGGTSQLAVFGAANASTTVQNQGSGSYQFVIGGTASTTMNYYQIADVTAAGLTFTASPNVNDLSFGSFIVANNNDTAITVGGTVLNASPALTLTQNQFATTSGVTTATNVTATGTAVSSWRFTNHYGDIDGEAFDIDPDGDPGYVGWDDSAALITVAGNVYSDEGSTVSSACDGTTNTIRLVVEAVTTYDTSCNPTTGFYSFSGVSYGDGNEFIVFINGTTSKAATVSEDPISNINNLDLYEDRVIVRHEGTDSLTIADMGTYDSSNDPDIQFTESGGNLTLPADTKLIVWTNKEFEPQGNVTVSGGGAGAPLDGTVELYAGSTWTSTGNEVHTIGGSLIAGVGATFTPANSTTTFTTSGAGRTIDINNGSFYNLEFTGSGSWTVTDSTLDAQNLLQTAGALTLPAGTTTISGFFNATGGTFDNNGGWFVFDGTNSNLVLAFGGSDAGDLNFTGTGSWSMTDTNATSTGGVTITGGTVSLPSGTLALADSFRNVAGAVTHNTSELIISTSSEATVLASSSDLFAITFDGGGVFTFEDENLTLLGSLVLRSGSMTLASGTMSIGGSFDASGGTFANATGTILFNSIDTGETINPGISPFYTVAFGSGTGGWTITGDATTTNMFSLVAADDFTLQSGSRLYVGGMFMNNLTNSSTTWSGTTLVLDSGTSYIINSDKTVGDDYETLEIGTGMDIRMWNSQATTTIVAADSSLYSQDHAAIDGHLYIYGNFHVGTTTEHWNYATDFDGINLPGSERPVTVFIADGATTTVDGGTLNIVGVPGNVTTVTNQGSGEYAFAVNAGTFNAQHYAFRNLNSTGLDLSGTPLIPTLSYGDFELAVDGGRLINLSSTTLNYNASLVVTGNRFATTTAISGTNVYLTGTTSNAWTFTSHTGNLDGEDFDFDGGTECGSVRWSDSNCLITQQTNFRWRNNDGGLGVPDSEWYDSNWSKRKAVRLDNPDTTSYTNAAIELTVAYDADMQIDFEDLRFTAADGTTLIDHFIASTTNSASAEVWVEVPTLTAEDTTVIYMYYGNPTALSTSSSTQTFIAADDFEDGGITEYVGANDDKALFSVTGSFAYGGSSFALDNSSNQPSRANDGGIARFDQNFGRGSSTLGVTVRYMQYVDTDGGAGDDETCTLFAVQSPVGNNENYAVCLEQTPGTNYISLSEDIIDTNEFSGTELASTSVTYSDGWYEIEVDWEADGDMTVTLYDDNESQVAQVSANDSTYTYGGHGFTYWSNEGGWDNFTVRPLVINEPTVRFGAEAVAGGATWAEVQDTAFDTPPNTTIRLRLAVENSGLAITNQNFDLEYAPRGTAPSCEAVSGASYSAVPNQATCGTSPLCMQTTTQYVDGAATTDLLLGVDGTFSAGAAVESPSNTTGNINIGQDFYTELEYTITATNNASSSNYCLRVTDSGAELDSYLEVAELIIRFDPTLGAISFNNGQNISLLPGTTTRVFATTTVTDLNGFTDIVAASSTMFTTSATAACTADNNNCYISTLGGQCSLSGCAGNSCELSCYADYFFHADPTFSDGGEFWQAFIEVQDTQNGVGFNTSPPVDVFELTALNSASVIDYGALEVASSTGSFNPTTTIQNIGNTAIDINIEGTNLSDGATSEIPANFQRFATSSFDYDSCSLLTQCTELSTTTISNYELDLTKPTSTLPAIEDYVYWGIEIPFGVASNPHTGVNTFYAVTD